MLRCWSVLPSILPYTYATGHLYNLSSMTSGLSITPWMVWFVASRHIIVLSHQYLCQLVLLVFSGLSKQTKAKLHSDANDKVL